MTTCRVGIDMAGGGLIIGPGAPTVFVEGVPISVVGDGIATHGEAPHTTGSSLIATGSGTVMAEGKFVAIAPGVVSCGHTLAPGSTTVITGL
jgi:uncharacterized Zn-binding protein involved in type VI secretion